MKVVIFWDYYGPYHIARLRGAIAAGKPESTEFIGLELAGRSETYAWKREVPAPDVALRTLFPNDAAESISGLRVYKAVYAFLTETSPDCLCVPSYWPAYTFAATLAARRVGVKVVLMAESHYASGRNEGNLVWVKRLFVSLYASALVGGSAQRSFFRYLGMPDSHIFDGYDAVDNPYFSNQASIVRATEPTWRQKLCLPRRYILSLGRFVAKKNLHVIIRSYAAARAQGKLGGVHLLFVGAGSERDSLVQLSRSLGFTVSEGVGGAGAPSYANEEYAVHFRPFAQIEDIPAYFALAECFILASLVEEWGLVVNEAMASGCPVLVSRLVGCSHDLVEHGRTGFRFDPANPEELAWYMAAVCMNPQLRARVLDEASKRICEWGPERFGRNLIKAARATSLPRQNVIKEERALRPIVLLQTSFPDYRVPVYQGLSSMLGDRFELHTGMEYFTPDVKTCAEFRPWIHLVKNSFFFKRKLLWQGGVLTRMLEADVAIVELNPRIVSNWLILVTRKLWGRPSLLWGHAWGREGSASLRNLLRLIMMRLANGVVTYTHTQRSQLQRVFPAQRFYAAANSLVTQEECVADMAEDLELILYVGRLNVAKKPKLLLEAFILLRDEFPPNVRLCFVGSGGEAEALSARTENAGMQERVLFKGHVGDRSILRPLYSKAFCAVSPGYVGLSAIQSFSFGVPMIIADKEDHAPEIEACTEGENTRFFAANDARALAACLAELWRDREVWRKRRPAISAWTAQNYSTDAMVSAFGVAIDEVKSTIL